MKKKLRRRLAFFKLRVLFGVLLCFAAVTIVLLAARQKPQRNHGSLGPSEQNRGLG